MARRPTIVDVARRAGVSKSTVSLVLQDSPLVRPATRKLVEEAIAELNYFRNRSAASLRSAGVGLVGLIINDLRNPFFTEFATSAQMAFAARGYATVLANTDEDPQIQQQVVASMIEHGVSAFVISPAYGGDPGIFDRIDRAGIPTLQVLRRIGQRSARFPFWSIDYRAGGRAATRHLIDLGLGRIAFAGGLEGRQITEERLAGYLEVMRDHGLAPQVLHGRPSRALGRDLARRLHRDHPQTQAVLCFSDLVALGMLAGMQELGIAVGEGIRIAGFDDIEECALVWPQITSVRCDIAGFGEAAATAMLAWLETGVRPEAERRAPVTLMPRRSTLGPEATGPA